MNCFLCDKPWDHVHKKANIVITEHFQQSMEEMIRLRDDEWAHAVRERIESTSLKEVRARYHTACINKFRYIATGISPGRPNIPSLEAALAAVCRYMEESDDCQFSFKELMEQMEGWETSTTTLKQKLFNKYGSDIQIFESRGKPSIVCFRNTGCRVLIDSCCQETARTDAEERLRVVSAAADIIREDIRSRVYQTSSYPAPAELFDDVEKDIPESLQLLLNQVSTKGKKNKGEKLSRQRSSIARAIISLVGPHN